MRTVIGKNERDHFRSQEGRVKEMPRRIVRSGSGGSKAFVPVLGVAVVGATLVGIGALAGPTNPAPGKEAMAKPTALEIQARMPVSFVENAGQVPDPAVRYTTTGGNHRLSLGPTAAAVAMGGANSTQSATVRIGLVGADDDAAIRGESRQNGRVNYFLGSDSSKWYRDLPTYGRVTTRGAYPGVDLTWYGQGDELEYDFVVAPHADPSQISMVIEGGENVHVDKSGDLIIETAAGELRQGAPRLYQLEGKVRRPVEGKFSITAPNTIGFTIGRYNPARALVIDPTLIYSTYLGGLADDSGEGIAVENTSGSGLEAYVTGRTCSTNFPTLSAAQGTFGGDPDCVLTPQGDAFVTRFDIEGDALAYSTYFGGSGGDVGTDIDVVSGAVYATGYTTSTNFPTTTGAYQTSSGGGRDAYVIKLNSSGALSYASYLGGAQGDTANGLTLGPGALTSGTSRSSWTTAYVVGTTSSSNFPTTANAIETTSSTGCPGASCRPEAFVAKVGTAGGGSADLIYSTYLGGSGGERGGDIAVKSDTAAGHWDDTYVVGTTMSSDFTTTSGAYQTALAGGQDAFVAKLTGAASGGATLGYATYLGGSTAPAPTGTGLKYPPNGGVEEGIGIAVDAAASNDRVYVTGTTSSTDFPLTSGAVRSSTVCWGRGCGSFVSTVAMNSAGSADLQYSTYIGVTGTFAAHVTSEISYVPANGSLGAAVVVSGSAFKHYSVTNCGNWDSFFMVIRPSPTGTATANKLADEPQCGTNAVDDHGLGVATSGSKVFLTGNTGHAPLGTPGALSTTAGAYQTTAGGEADAFVRKYRIDDVL